jgi:hypothetical protein
MQWTRRVFSVLEARLYRGCPMFIESGGVVVEQRALAASSRVQMAQRRTRYGNPPSFLGSTGRVAGMLGVLGTGGRWSVW